MKLLGISGTILGSKTAVLVKQVLDEVEKLRANVQIEFLDLKNYELQFCDGRPTSHYNDDTQEVIKKVSEADLYLIGSPIFNGSIPAPLKNVFDLVSPEVFRHKVMGFVANGGTYQHYLVIENQLKPIAGYLRCYVAPSYVYAHSQHFNTNNEIIDTDLLNRIQKLATELIIMHRGIEKTKRKGGIK
ncbi:FMN reductase/FAD reductase [NAD(P)H] [Caldalkalibacillus uzonensis]|uniref:FMN reductase/FAD reductase [NAD(P)H] n=1 Tax=Caldalkalibacillus uzonensis TaxID=353224 RepID=A0ABU0CY08_9BACI|nr:NAD(P)H-dependent oxidoreductase [Caldalkalibacillus uzonensis]MDQ0341022.1 FMN reductase/FAD reductase [NAD(P)H] [Caldalkalibacillus uzonensis]